MKLKLRLLCTFAFVVSTMSAQVLTWDEPTDGDLSDDNLFPSGPFTFDDDDFSIISDQQGTPRDVDYFTIVIAPGQELFTIAVKEYTAADPSNLAFIGIVEGATMPTDFSNTTAADLLGGTTFGVDDVDFNILSRMGILDGAEGFVGALPEGTYTIWINQTGDINTSELIFEVFEADDVKVAWDEDFDGDLSSDFTTPTGVFNLPLGFTEFFSIQAGSPNDVDYFTFTIANGLQLESIFLEDYEPGSDASNQAFIGIVEGSAFPNDATSTTSADLLGGFTYGQTNLDEDILPLMGTLSGATGFSGPLTAGTYTIWMNQTGAQSEAALIFVVDQNLSVSENQLAENDIQLYPNPATNILVFKSSFEISGIRIFDSAGRIVLVSTNLEGSDQTLTLESLSKGMYIAEIETSQGTVSKRIIKQ